MGFFVFWLLVSFLQLHVGCPWEGTGTSQRSARSWLSSFSSQTAYRPMTILWRYYNTSFFTFEETASSKRSSHSRTDLFFEILYFQEFCLSTPRFFFQKSTKNHQKKFAGLRPAPPPYGAACVPPTKAGAKCLAAMVLDNQDRVLRHSARLLGESCWPKNEGQLEKKIAQELRNSHKLSSSGEQGQVTQGINWRKSWNQMQTLKDCLCCHICCAQLETSWDAIVGASRAVSNRESRYPHFFSCFAATQVAR